MQTAYATLANGRQIHYRANGKGPPLVLLHPSPQHSETMLPAMSAFSAVCTCIAFDTPGYGLSDPLEIASPTLGDYADTFIAGLDALGIERCFVYGAATGAQIAIEMGKRYPERVRFVMLDSNGEMTDAERAEYIADGYFADVTPCREGGHLLTYWEMCRNLFHAFPWYSDHPRHRLGLDAPPVEVVHATFLRYLMAGENYADAYRPAFYAERLEHMEGLNVPSTMTRWESSPVLALADTLIDRGLPDNVELLRAGHGTDARYGVQLEALRARIAAEPLPAIEELDGGAIGSTGRAYLPGENGKLHLHRERGGGPLLILLHGAGQSGRAILKRARGLTGENEVWALDLPGHGASEELPAGQDLSVETMADSVKVALHSGGVREASIIATGIGAEIARHLNEHFSIGSIRVLEPIDRLSRAQMTALGDTLADLVPRADGTHLITAWDFARNRRVFWPPWDHSAKAQRETSLSTDPEEIHAEVADMLRVGANWREMMTLELAIDWDAILSDPRVQTIKSD